MCTNSQDPARTALFGNNDINNDNNNDNDNNNNNDNNNDDNHNINAITNNGNK